MEPGKNAQYANLQGTGRHDLHAPQTGIVNRCNVRRPYYPAGGYQASEAFLRGNTQEMASSTGLRSRLGDGNVSRRRINIAVASLVPVDVIALIWLGHCASTLPQKWRDSRVTSVTLSVVRGEYITTETVQDEAPEIFPFMGNSRLAEVVDRHGADLVVHGHAHHGKTNGRTTGGIAVHNVAISLLQSQQPTSVYRVFDV